LFSAFVTIASYGKGCQPIALRDAAVPGIRYRASTDAAVAVYQCWQVFTRATLASAGISCRRVSMSVTSRCSIETAKCRITQTTPHDGPGTLVSDAENLSKTQTESPPTGAQNAGGIGEMQLR